MDAITLPIKLEPETGVRCEGLHYYALSPEPWFEIVPNQPFLAGQIIEITYRSSFWDEPTRPIFRFWSDKKNFKDIAGTAPVVGSASISLTIPENTKKLSVSPVKAMGRFDFIIENFQFSSRFDVFKKSLIETGFQAQVRILRSLVKFKTLPFLELDWGLGLTSVENFPQWLKRNLRSLDLEGCDAPRCDWSQVPEIQLFLPLDTDDLKACMDTIKSLQAQIFDRWRLNILTKTKEAIFSDHLPLDPRVRLMDSEDFVNFLGGLAAEVLVSSLKPGDELYPNALAMIAELQARHPAVLLFYGDECAETAGSPMHPVLKPGWSPFLAVESGYLGRAAFVGGAQLQPLKTAWIESGRLNHSGLSHLVGDQVLPVRRFLLKTSQHNEIVNTAPPPPFASTEINPSAMIIIPARDQTDLLGRCLRSIFERTSFQNFSIIIVDNDSEQLASKKFFKAFFGDKIVSVSHSPGDFNFSALCNAGASRRRPDVLVFLKNFVEIQSEDWLTRLMAHALLPGAGAVGPTALYHGRKLSKALAAFMPFEKTAHDVLAVSADCLAVGRRKFLLAGGFDAANYPNVLQNVDLCLRLREKGFVSRVDPAIRINTANAPKLAASGEEKIRFQERWSSLMREDPYFHPALSLFFAEDES